MRAATASACVRPSSDRCKPRARPGSFRPVVGVWPWRTSNTTVARSRLTRGHGEAPEPAQGRESSPWIVPGPSRRRRRYSAGADGGLHGEMRYHRPDHGDPAFPEVTMPVTRFDVTLRRPLADGGKFGDVGPYEELKGRLHFQVDPVHPSNERITDVRLAPWTGAGRVEFSADVSLLLPVDRGQCSGRLLLDVVNRGNTVSVPNFN